MSASRDRERTPAVSLDPTGSEMVRAAVLKKQTFFQVRAVNLRAQSYRPCGSARGPLEKDPPQRAPRQRPTGTLHGERPIPVVSVPRQAQDRRLSDE
jgi:hypothetical protein